MTTNLDQLTTDDPITLDANYRFSIADRRYIDEQIRALQSRLLDSLLLGKLGSWFDLHSGSDIVNPGDVVCLSSVAGTVTKALTTPLANSKAATGVVITTANPGAKVFVAHGGILPPEITALSSGSPGFVRVIPGTGRLQMVSSLTSSDYGVGVVDNAGYMQIQLGTQPAAIAATNDGKDIYEMGDADTIVDSVAVGIMETTGSLSAERLLTFPAPSSGATSYIRTVQNSCTGGFTIRVGTDATGSRTVQVFPGTTSVILFDEHGAKELSGKVYDPRDFGCPWDGIHDDLPGLQAMMSAITVSGHPVARIQLPPGKGYCSDSWDITHPVIVNGAGWGIDDTLSELKSGIRFPALKAGIICHSYFTSPEYPDGMASQGSTFRDVMINGLQGIVTLPDTGAGRGLRMIDTSIDIRVAGTYVEKGTVVVAVGSTNTYGAPYLCEGATRDDGPAVMFRCTVAGTPLGAEPEEFGVATIANIGDTIADTGTLQWVVESVPRDYKNNTAYTVGERVYVPGDPSFYFECIEAGTSRTLTTLPTGIGVSVPMQMRVAYYGGQFYDTTDDVLDPGTGPGLRWRAHIPAGFLVLAENVTIDHCGIAGFTGAGVHATDQTDAVIYGSPTAAAANFTVVRDSTVVHCGLGFRVSGGNSNGCLVDNLNVYFIGMGRTNVDGVDYLNNADPTFGTGASAAWDCSLGACSFRQIYMQFATAVPFRNDRYDGAGSASFWAMCRAEVDEPAHFVGDALLLQVSPLPLTTAGRAYGIQASGHVEKDYVTAASPITANIATNGLGLYSFKADDESYTWAYNYVSGSWGLQYGVYVPRAFTLTGTATGVDPGMGWFVFNRGFLHGSDSSVYLFQGPYASAGGASAPTYDRNLRQGERKAGDRFQGGITDVRVNSNGFRGERWAVSTTGLNIASSGFPAYMMEPSANGTMPPGGLQVFECTTAGNGGAVEPSWAAAVVPGVDTVTDGTAVWTLAGYTPYCDTDQTADLTSVATRRVVTTTTTAAASQIIFTAQALDDVDMALADGTVSTVVDTVLVKKSGTTNGGSVKVESTWIRDGGAPTQIGATSITYNLSGATLDGSTAAHVLNGNRVELQVSPESADTLTWVVFRTQTIGFAP